MTEQRHVLNIQNGAPRKFVCTSQRGNCLLWENTCVRVLSVTNFMLPYLHIEWFTVYSLQCTMSIFSAHKNPV